MPKWSSMAGSCITSKCLRFELDKPGYCQVSGPARLLPVLLLLLDSFLGHAIGSLNQPSQHRHDPSQLEFRCVVRFLVNCHEHLENIVNRRAATKKIQKSWVSWIYDFIDGSYPSAFAIMNAAVAASPPTTTVCQALRNGLAVVKLPLM